MSTHVSEELPRLLTGEAPRNVVLDAAAHLRTCADCQQELVSAVVAHASLTSALRFAPEIVGRSGQASAQTTPPPATLPDLSAVFAQVREESVAPVTKLRSRRPLYAAAAVAAGVLIGGGGYAVISSGHTTSAPPARNVALAAFDTGRSPASAKITGAGQMTLDATSLPSLSSQQRYEVWLTNDGRTKMQPIGWIGTNGRATLTVPADLMGNYSDIEVSVQKVNADTYTYSGTSVLRGAYA